MDAPGPLHASPLLGSMDTAHYTPLQHPLQGYGGAIGGPLEAGVMPPAATITLGYSVSHPAPAPPYTVALTPQVSAHTQIQYFYEASEPLTPHVQVRYTPTTAHCLQHPSPPLQVLPLDVVRKKSPDVTRRKADKAIQGHQEEEGRNKADGAIQSHQAQRNSARRRRAPGAEGTSAKLSRKQCRNRGEAYVSASGKAVPAKQYVEQDCQCRNECLTKLGTLADREAVFRRFWEIGDFVRQNARLAQSVVLVPSVRRKRPADPPPDDRHLRTVRRIYYVKLQEGCARVRVCKGVFLRLHGVSNGRLDRVLQALHCSHPLALQDRRGQHSPSNKTAREDLELATQHVLRWRQHGPGTPTLTPAATGGEAGKVSVKRLHEVYVRWCEAQGRTPVSLWVYRHVEKTLKETDTKAGSMSNTPPANAPTCNEVATECQEAVMVSGGTTSLTDGYKHGTLTTTPNTTTSESANIITPNNNNTTATITASAITTVTPTTTTEPTTTITTVIPTTITITPATTTTTTITTTTATALESPRTRRKQGGSGSSNMSRKDRKTLRNRGEAYITSTGKLQDRKVYHDVPCECRLRCIPALGTPEARRGVFDGFWGLASFTRQNTHIGGLVTLAPLGDRRTGAALARTYSRVYRVCLKEGGEMVRVCKLAFLRLHGISNGRVDRVLQAVACQSPFALKDRRGRHSPTNKTREEDVSHALRHMCSFPPEHPEGRRPPPDLSVERMYRLYREVCVCEGRTPVGNFVYRKIMKERLHGRVKTPANKTPERDLQFARHHIKAWEGTGFGGGGGSAVEGRVRCLHQGYVERCGVEGRKAVGVEVFRRLCHARPAQTKPKQLHGTQL